MSLKTIRVCDSCDKPFDGRMTVYTCPCCGKEFHADCMLKEEKMKSRKTETENIVSNPSQKPPVIQQILRNRETFNSSKQSSTSETAIKIEEGDICSVTYKGTTRMGKTLKEAAVALFAPKSMGEEDAEKGITKLPDSPEKTKLLALFEDESKK